MRIRIDPPLDHWRLAPRAGDAPAALTPLLYRTTADGAAPRLATHHPILATGHQPWLWHPGILAKDLATATAARRLGAAMLHVVVDHDVLDPLRLDVPVQRDHRLEVETIRLGAARVGVPVGAQEAVEARTPRDALARARDALGDALCVDLQPLIDAIELTRGVRFASLAEQVAAWTAALLRPLCGEMPMVPTSDLLHTEPGEALLREMLSDAMRCVRRYNAAVAAHPEAGVAALVVERERVELPIWRMGPGQPRRRVFADLADSTPMLTLDDGTPIAREPGAKLAPRALLLTALMRSRFCAMFVHGLGGGVYDRITDQWWREWRDETLAPSAVVTADVHLPFDAPVASDADLAHARWLWHYAPYNIDRLLHLDHPLAAQKRRLLEDLAATRHDRCRHDCHRRDRFGRWLAFREIHRLNAALCRQHPQPLHDAQRRLDTAHLGLANARIARKRDWCFALYPSATLHDLHEAMDRTAPAATGQPMPRP